MPLLYYWRPDNYRRDLDYGAGYHLNQGNRLLHHIDEGDSLWAFTRARDGRYALAAELVVRVKTLNPPGFRYGRYRLWGDLRRSRYFLVEGQPSVDPVVRSLSCRVRAAAMGQAFQGHAAVRALTVADHQVLVAAAAELSLEPRARILPEERLEAALLLGDPEAVAELIQDEDPGIAAQRREYLYQQAPTRNRELVRRLQELYDGRCQLCRWNPRNIYGEWLCHGHHIHWLSRGGEDAWENLALLCPNHHAAVHRCDAPLDFGDGSFVFSSHREMLRLERHLLLNP
jgi:hypothetical protein